jgi:benzoyl-CoA reductase/2-hydroxyglutaryl-CoA dehydratase subunit BcrC/BadD/HgdB
VVWYTQELEMLRANIKNTLGVHVDDKEISESIGRTNELRRILLTIQGLRKGPDPKLTGEEMHRIMIAVNSTPTDAALEALGEVYPKLEAREAIAGHRARLLIMGSQMDDPAYIEAMEQMGALIVGDAFCEGSIQFTDLVDENEAPMTALAKRYLRKLSCPRMFEGFDERYGRVVKAFQECQADGIVFATMKFCDTWGIDAPLFMNRLRDQGIQVLRLEREYMLGGVGQLRTRVQAFIEMLGR